MSRTVVWFSAGAASAVAAKLTIASQPDDLHIVYCDTRSEHADNARFIEECEHWFDHPIETISSDKYEDTWDVWERTRYLVGPAGARCTGELKKRPRVAYERPDDVQVFGYTVEESHRADRFREQNPGVQLACPLIYHGLTKADCLAMIDRAGIELPAMYLLGFENNNCLGCPKGGMAYWQHIRRHFPGVYWRMAKLERDLGHTVIRDKDGAVWLDELDPDRTRPMADEPDMDCSLMCAIAEDVIAQPVQITPTTTAKETST